jgi:hypothetical protein
MTLRRRGELVLKARLMYLLQEATTASLPSVPVGSFSSFIAMPPFPFILLSIIVLAFIALVIIDDYNTVSSILTSPAFIAKAEETSPEAALLLSAPVAFG